MRKDPLVVEEVYHIYNKSIAEYIIFNNDFEYARMLNVICYYQQEKPAIKFSDFIRSSEGRHKNHFPLRKWESNDDKGKLVEIIAYCVMPTHIHLILKQLKENGISATMRRILDSYTRYFNIKHERKGPLWEGKFKNRLIETDNDLLGMTRYIHLNPTTACLVDKPEQWLWSSYKEYLSEAKEKNKICKFDDILNTNPSSYREFVEDRIAYQRELARIKHLLIDGE